MKENYEIRSRSYLTRRTPVIIRLDGRSFSKYTRGLNKPFDEGFIEDMVATAEYLCSNVQGAIMAYTQSDEISLLLCDYKNLDSDAWFDYEIQKMCSISASITTAKFNQLRSIRGFETLVNFDSRTFNIPESEVANYFLARQSDAIRNSISMLAGSLYTHKELHGKNSGERLDMIYAKGVSWDNLDHHKKDGSITFKDDEGKWNSFGVAGQFNNFIVRQIYDSEGIEWGI